MIETLPELLRAAIADERVQLIYRHRVRDVCIHLIEPGVAPRYAPHYGGATIEIDHCPWTGTKLPDDLVHAFQEVVEQELGLERYDFEWDDPKLPEEMYSDEWWRRRTDGELAALNTRKWTPPQYPPDATSALIIDLDGQYRHAKDLPLEVVDPNEFVTPGFRRTAGRLPHFCDHMGLFGIPTLMFAYLPWTREFGIRMLDPQQPPDYQPLRIRPIHFCPWCGEALPKSLRQEWSGHVSPSPREPKDRRLDPEIDASPPIGTRAYYCFDNWWRDAGL